MWALNEEGLKTISRDINKTGFLKNLSFGMILQQIDENKSNINTNGTFLGYNNRNNQ